MRSKAERQRAFKGSQRNTEFVGQLRTRHPSKRRHQLRLVPAAGTMHWYNRFVKARSLGRVQPGMNSPEALERFRRAAEAFTVHAIRSQATARRVLVEEGIYTKTGKLTKQYS
jgi:hypothetical protein